MKLTVTEQMDCAETEISVTCRQMDDTVLRLVAAIRAADQKLTGVRGGRTFVLEPGDVFYFDSVDKKTFLYTQSDVYETPLRLYELEERFSSAGFFRAGKSTVINLSRVRELDPSFGGKIEVTLENGEHLLVSRQYVPHLKTLLGL